MNALEKRVGILVEENNELKRVRTKLKITKSRGSALERRIHYMSQDNVLLKRRFDALQAEVV
ncbi:hypothetical protein CRE_03390 [Caenorhabditis remanei]|uniref:Uncharacterized protein n=1 Tax=Caenorhabditis remanei TaxID=31234 RepID=E3N668_CAERE|nr:hypothetical protein CRE_03390 [Caenorhabditis remanei]